MKNILALVITILIMFSLTACSESNPSINSTIGNTSGSSSENNNSKRPVSDESKILIAYFSRVGNTNFDEEIDVTTTASLNLQDGELAGNTEVIANMIQDAAGGDLFLIETEKKYSADYDIVVDYGQQEQKEKTRPKLSSHIKNMEDYDIVFIGFPNWWYDMPMAVYSFLEEYDFNGKTVIPFTTHGGSGFSSSEKKIKSMLNGATMLEGLAVSGSKSTGAQRDVNEWLRKLGMTD